MPHCRADSLTHALLQDTVLAEWFEPMQQAVEKLRYSDRLFQALPMISFALLGGLRQLLCMDTLREQVQSLFHYDVSAEQVPVARSTWSDAMGSRLRRDILRQAIVQLVAFAQTALGDKLAGIEGIAVSLRNHDHGVLQNTT